MSGLLDHRGRPISSGSFRDTQHYSASTIAREFDSWHPSSGSPDIDNNAEIGAIQDRTRDLDRNSGVASNIRVALGDNIIARGLQLSPSPDWRVLGRSPEWARDIARELKAAWKNHSGSTYWDADGEDNFAQQSRMMFDSEHLGGGGIGIPMWEEHAGTPYRTCMKLIESDRLCNPEDKRDDSLISGGVQRSKSGRIEGYHILNVHPGDPNAHHLREWEFIPIRMESGRRRFLHQYKKTRPGQSRGIPAASRCLAEFGLHTKYRLTELQSQAVNAKFSQVLETPLSDEAAAALFGASEDEVKKLRENWRGTLTAGSILKLPPGSKLMSIDPKRPAPSFMAFMEGVARDICASFNIPFELGTRNFSKTNYSSARAALLEAWRHFYVERDRIVTQWASPCYELWLEDHLDLFGARGDLQSFYQNRSAWVRGAWNAPAQLPIDQLKTINAQKIGLEIGVYTREEIAAERGMDWEDVEEQTLVEAMARQESSARLAKHKRELQAEYGDVPEPPPTPPADPSAPQSDEDIDKLDEQEEEDETQEREEAQAA